MVGLIPGEARIASEPYGYTERSKIINPLLCHLELAIKSVKHDQKLCESFKIKRPYLSFCLPV